jgi:hypothetical protein
MLSFMQLGMEPLLWETLEEEEEEEDDLIPGRDQHLHAISNGSLCLPLKDCWAYHCR